MQRSRLRLAAGYRPVALLGLSLVAGSLAAGLLWPRTGASYPQHLQLTFEDPPVNLSSSPNEDSETPRVVVTEAGTVHVIWQEYAENNFTSSNLLARHRPAGGAFSEIQHLARSAQDPALVTWGEDGAAATYASGRPGATQDDIEFKILLNLWDSASGAWSRRGQAVPTGNGGVQPSIAFAEDRFWLAWVDASSSGQRRPQYAAVRNHPTPDPIGDTLSLFDDNVQAPQVAAASDGEGETDIHIAWMNSYGTESEITHLWLPAAQPTPSVNRELGAYYLFGQARRPALAATRRQNICLAWQEAVTSPGNFHQDVIQMCSPWTAPTNLSESTTASGEPSLALDDDNGSLILWQERLIPRVNEEIRFLQGAPPITSTVFTGTVSMPHLAFHPGSRDVHAVWVANAPGAAGTDIFYARWKVDAPTPSPSPSPMPSPSATASATNSPTPPSPTTTPSPEFTPTPLTPTITPTPSRTPRPSATATPSPTPVDTIFVPALHQRLPEP